jgi:hypothetical protein
MIKWSLDSRRRTAEYTGRLGLPQTEASKRAIGRTKFEGEGAERCEKLYKATIATVKSLKRKYTTVADLRSAIDR